MEYRQLGKSGLQISAISLGAWSTIGETLNFKQSKAILDKAYSLGVNFFDNADVYNNGQSEIALGKLLKYFKWPRENYLISSKVFWGIGSNLPNTYGLSRKHIFEACHASLKRMQVDYLDLYFCHRPDPNTPILETVQVMSDLIHQGKILYWGTSEWNLTQLEEVYKITHGNNYLISPVAEQSQYNLFSREKIENELLSLYNNYGLGFTIWSPLRSGLLAGRYNNGIPSHSRLALKGYEWLRHEIMGEDEEARLTAVKALTKFANEELGISLAELSLAWCLRNNKVTTAITGASHLNQIIQNINAISLAKKLDENMMLTIDKITGFDFSNLEERL